MKKRVVNKILIIALHVFGWALLFMMPFRFISRGNARFAERMPPSGGGAGPAPPEHMIQTIPFDPMWFRIEAFATNVLLAIFFYLNMFIFVPRILSKKSWWPYTFIVVLAFSIYLFAGYAIRLYFIPAGDMGRPFGPPLFVGVPNFLMVFGLSLALRIMQDRSSFEAALKEQENEKLKSELSFLRSQVSPHFMFNVLNSLASLARKKSDQVESAIIQLSQLMRYSLYHTEKKVTLEQEAEYLSNYIELQKLRFGSTINMHFHVDIERKETVIEPMLLVPFVENAFKHGVGLIHEPVIIILLEATAYRISFTVRNRFNPSSNEVKDESSGIGLQNVRRRLDLLYKDLYTLEIYKTDDNWFITELKIIPE
ncbi:sensor histidine kinase [Ohtaekwangia koreensis]|uniref:Histidine kinase n=1 Tax=Ohtaekwangia koreensis TaxID=688867 RepID=A0A1T5L661_9BACT|nr:histidine kinase [Ohtaekwangia koreensis]SKC71522.1 Histidine kinase [Ohtaekwangia koreensis]